MVKVSTHIPKQPRNGFYKKENISYAIGQPKLRQTIQIRKDETKMTNTALQVTNFDFYGDKLIALQDNATGEIYTAISHILKGIGFTSKQVEHQQKKILNDELLRSHTLKFSGVDLNMPSVNEIWCISQRKLPLALAKINITPTMRKKQPELSDRLLKYQDKCADVLASVFIDHKAPDSMQPILDALTSLTNTLNTTIQSMNERIANLERNNNQTPAPQKKKFSYWSSKMFPKYQALMDYFGIDEYKNLYHQLFNEFSNTYPSIELNQIIDDYCYENNLQNCFTLDAIEHNKDIRKLFESMVDSLLEKYNLISTKEPVKCKPIFDE